MPKVTHRISVVAPAYNESENVEVFYETMKSVLDALTSEWEIVCVDDGSRDDTLEKLIALHQKDPRVKVIGLSRNFGKEIALTAGLDHADGDAIVPIDFDLQDPPELIEKMVELWQQGHDVVYATRIRREGETLMKKMTASLFYRFIRKISHIDIPKDTGDFRLIDRRVLDALKTMRETHRFMKGLFSWVGYKQISLPYERQPRHAGQTSFNYLKLWNFAIEGITSFSIVPLQLATYGGALVSVFAFLYAVIIVIKTLIFGESVEGYPSMMVTILFLGGVQLMTIGFIGEYVGRIYSEVKQRPLYFIRDKFE